MKYTLNEDGTVTIHHPVRFNSHVMAEFQAMLDSVDDVEEPELSEVLASLDDPKVVFKRNYTKVYEVDLTLGAVEAFAKEVAYYLWHAVECRSECDGYGDRHAYNDITKTVTACRTALSNANKVLVTAGLTEVTF
jgi:uncharacterized membrane protein